MSRKYSTKRLLQGKGSVLVTFSRDSGGTFDETTSEVTSQTTKTVSSKGMLSAFSDEQINGAEIQRNDLRIQVPVVDFEGTGKFVPQDGDKASVNTVLGNQEFIVRRVRYLDNGIALLVQLRGGAAA